MRIVIIRVQELLEDIMQLIHIVVDKTVVETVCLVGFKLLFKIRAFIKISVFNDL